MNSPLVTIITPTYNKPKFFSECAQSVLAQTFKEWVWWVAFNREHWHYGYDLHLIPNIPLWNDARFMPIWYPVSESGRQKFHIPAQIINWLYPRVQTPYIYFLADDDLIDPDGLLEMTKHIGPVIEDGIWRGNIDAVYGRCEVQSEQPDGSFKTTCWCYEHGDVGLGTEIDPHCRLDGGQVLHTKALWDKASDGWTLDESKEVSASCDGLLLSRFAQFARFHYIPQRIVTHRRTNQSTFHKPQLEG